MPARKRSRRQSSARRIEFPKDPLAMRLQFQQLRVRKVLQRGRGEGNCLDCGHDVAPPPSSTSASIARIPGWIVQIWLRIKWCMDTERALNDGIQFLQDYGDQLTEQQREDFRKDLAELLGFYGELC